VCRKFKFIEYEKAAVDFVCCLECNSVFAYNNKQGTGTLSRHKCVRRLQSLTLKQPKIAVYSTKIVPQSALNRLIAYFHDHSQLPHLLTFECATFLAFHDQM